MNNVSDSQMLQQLVDLLSRQAERHEQTVHFLKLFGSNAAAILAFALAVALPLLLVAMLVYRPRLMRGSLWLPFFGLFGGTPTLYMHSRPASLGGRFWKSLRRRSHSGGHRA